MSTFMTMPDTTQGRVSSAPIPRWSRARVTLLLCLMGVICAATVWSYHVWFRAMMNLDAPVLSPQTSEAVHRSSAWTTLKLFLTLGILSFAAIYGVVRQVCPRRLIELAVQHRRAGIGATLLVGVVLTIWFGIALRGEPSIEDDLTYFFQARLFAHGEIMLPTHTWGPLADAFYWWWTVPGTEGVCSYQFPGHSIMLMLGVFAGRFSIVPILQAMVTCYATYRAGLMLYGRRTAVLAMILIVTSPYVLTVFSSYSASTSAACVVSLSLWAWAVVLRRGNTGAALLLGASIGMLCWVRPPTAVFVAIPLGGLLLARIWRGHLPWRLAMAGLSTGIPLIALYVGYCAHVTGQFSLSPGNQYATRYQQTDDFGTSNLTKPSDSPLGIRLPSEVISVARMNMYLFGWPFSLALLIVLPFLAYRQSKTLALLVAALSVVVFYSMYRNVVGWYYFEVGPIWFILGARGLVLLRQWMARRNRNSAWQSVLPRLIVAAILFSCCHTIPLTMAREWSYVHVFNESHNAVIRRAAGQRAAILIDDESGWEQLRRFLLGMNFPHLDGSIVYVDAYKRDWTLQQLNDLVGPRQLYYLRYKEGSADPLQLEATDGKELIAVTQPAGSEK